jgi:hypothetical protein
MSRRRSKSEYNREKGSANESDRGGRRDTKSSDRESGWEKQAYWRLKRELEDKSKMIESFKEKEDQKKKESEEVSLTSRIANSVKEVLGTMGLSRGSSSGAPDTTGGQINNHGAASHSTMGQAPLQAHVPEPQHTYGAAMPQQFGYNAQGIQPPMGVAQPPAFFHPYNAAVQGHLQMYDGMRAMDMAMGIAGRAQRQQAQAGAEPFAGLKHIDGYRGYAPMQKEWRDSHRRTSRGSRRSPSTSRSRSRSTTRSGKGSQAAGSHGPTNSYRASASSRGRSRSPMLPTRGKHRSQRAGRDTSEGTPGPRHGDREGRQADREGRQGDRKPDDKYRPIKIIDAKEKWSTSEMWRRAADLVRAGAEIEPEEGTPKVTDETTAMEYANWLAEQTTLKVLLKIGDDAGIAKVCSSKPKQAQNLIKAIFKNFEADEEE